MDAACLVASLFHMLWRSGSRFEGLEANPLIVRSLRECVSSAASVQFRHTEDGL